MQFNFGDSPFKYPPTNGENYLQFLYQFFFQCLLRIHSDLQDFGFLDPGPQKYAEYQPKTVKKKLLFKPKSELLKKERLKNILNG